MGTGFQEEWGASRSGLKKLVPSEPPALTGYSGLAHCGFVFSG